MKKEDAMKILDSLLWSGYFAPLVWPSELLLENPTFWGGTSPSSEAGRGAPSPVHPILPVLCPGLSHLV